MSVVSDFVKRCAERRHDVGPMTLYRFSKDDLKQVRVELLNLNIDEEQEAFLLGQLIGDGAEPIEIPQHIVDHLIDYLKGAMES